jgi:hypothetical protein
MVHPSPDVPAGEQKMAKPKSAFTEAAAELWSDLGNRYWADIIPSEAREYVNADVIVSWLASESQGREYETICADVMAQRLTSDQARTLLLAASIDHSAKVLELFKDAVVEQIARDLVYAANKLGENFDPSDSEMARSSYASQVDDPLIGDRRHLARMAR